MIDAILPKEKVDLKIDCSLINLRTVPKSFSGLKIGQIRFLKAAVLSITCAYPIMKSYCLLGLFEINEEIRIRQQPPNHKSKMCQESHKPVRPISKKRGTQGKWFLKALFKKQRVFFLGIIICRYFQT